MVDSVLVAMDDSPLSREALVFALDAFPDADITVVHVAYPDIDMLPADTEEVYEADLDDLDGVGDETAVTVFETIRDVVGDHETGDGRDPDGDRELSVTFLLGEANRRIVEYVDEGEFDHVVMGTHGRQGLSRLLIGSVSEDVVRETDVPTTLVR